MINNAQDIIDAVPLEEVIKQYVDLSRRGVNLIGCCPFHDEKTPSFTVSPAKGIYKCFGCGKGGGNAATFLMDKENITFPEALEKLATFSNVAVEYATNREDAIKEAKETRDKKELQYKAITQAYDVIKKAGLIGRKKEVELAGKTYTQETIKKWGIVIHPDSILNADKKLDQDTLLQIGMIAKNKKDIVYDFFYGRILFPIHHPSGRIEGFTARHKDVTPNKKTPKYTNSPESLIYNKSKSLYGLSLNGESIRKKYFAYLVEGPTDVVMLDQNGISNTVASCGTALTKEQAKILSRYTDRVVIMTDGDAAGNTAALKQIDILVAAQLEVAVLPMPAGEDPASFIKSAGVEEFKEYSDSNYVDGIKHRIQQILGKNPSETARAEAVNTAGHLLSQIESSTLVSSYVRSLSKVIGVTSKIITDNVSDHRNLLLQGKRKLSPEQEADKMKYGVYVDKHRYYDHNGLEISNFELKPIFLIRSGDKSFRVFDMINENKISHCIIIDSDNLTQLGLFRKKTEMYGHYLFSGDDKKFLKLRNLIYADMDKVHQLPYLGYINSSGVYAWGNGLTTPEGEFIPVDEYGRVDYDDVSYYMPAYSKIKAQEVVRDDDESDYELQFTFHPGDMDIQEWSKNMHKLYGGNALIAMAYYFAALHRDFVQKRFNSFPILNLFGPPGSGKSSMARMIHSLYGKSINAVHCVTSTWSSFFRRTAQTKNAICWYEEYSEKVEKERQEGLKGFFDGFGRPLAKKETSNKVESIPVYSAVMLSGQVLPTHDPALLTRCITLFFEEVNADAEGKKLHSKMENIADSGQLSSITAYLHQYREQVLSKFESTYEDIKKMILDSLKEDEQPTTRVLINYTVVATFYHIISDLVYENDRLNLPKNMLMLDAVVERIKSQNQVNEGSTELTEFWNMLEYLIDQDIIGIDHYEVSEVKQVTIQDGKSSEVKVFNSKRTVLFMRLNIIHREYMRNARSQGIERVLDQNSIKYYLRIHKAFIGQGVRKLNGKDRAQRIWAFDLDLVGVDLAKTNHLEEAGFEPPSPGGMFDQGMEPQKEPDFN